MFLSLLSSFECRICDYARNASVCIYMQVCNPCRYIPDVSRAIYDVLQLMAGPAAKRQKFGFEYQDMLEKVAKREITEATLKQKLTQHVQQVQTFFFLSSSFFVFLFVCFVSVM